MVTAFLSNFFRNALRQRYLIEMALGRIRSAGCDNLSGIFVNINQCSTKTIGSSQLADELPIARAKFDLPTAAPFSCPEKSCILQPEWDSVIIIQIEPRRIFFDQ